MATDLETRLENTLAVADEPVKKRGRGRPRKVNAEDNAVSEIDSVDSDSHLTDSMLKLKNDLASYGFVVPDSEICDWHDSKAVWNNIVRTVAAWEMEYENCGDLETTEIPLADRTGVPSILDDFQMLDAEQFETLRNQGALANKQFIPQSRNPYPPESAAAMAWNAGWTSQDGGEVVDGGTGAALQNISVESESIAEHPENIVEQSENIPTVEIPISVDGVTVTASGSPQFVAAFSESFRQEDLRKQRATTDRTINASVRRMEKIDDLTTELIEAHEEIDAINERIESLKSQMKAEREELDEAVTLASSIAKKIKEIRSGVNYFDFQGELPFHDSHAADPQIPQKTAAEMDSEKQIQPASTADGDFAESLASTVSAPPNPPIDIGGEQDLDILRKGRLQKLISIPCDGLGLSVKQIEKLKSEIGGTGTIADFEKFVQQNPWWHRDIKGFGEETVAKIQDAWVAFRRDPKFAAPDNSQITSGNHDRSLDLNLT